MKPMIPPKHKLTILFAHPVYKFAEEFESRALGIGYIKTLDADDTRRRIPEADVLVTSGLWHNDMLEVAGKLKFIMCNAAGYNQFDLDLLRARGIRLANARGVNSNAVSEQAMGLILSFTRMLHIARDNQAKRHWRGMIADPAVREDELPGKTMLIFGLGTIGQRLATLAKAFGMRVIGFKRNLDVDVAHVDELHAPEAFTRLLPEADFVTITCPLTVETENIIGDEELAAMKRSAYLINMARGKCVNEPALIEALRQGQIAGAGLDTFWEEPLAPHSPLWDMENVIINPHTGGETRLYEKNTIDLLVENMNRLWQDDVQLENQIV